MLQFAEFRDGQLIKLQLLLFLKFSAIEMHNRSFEHINRKDVFRVEFRRHHKNNMKTRNGSNDYGTREVGVVLLSGQRPNVDRTADSTTAESSTSTTYTDPSATSSASTSTSTTGGVTCAACPDRAARKDQQFLMRIAIAVALISTLGLMLPLNGDSQSMLPQLLHLSPQFKQVLAFASGLSIGFTLSC